MAAVTVDNTGRLSPTGVDGASFRPHVLHRDGRTYLETNCYMDIVIELLHARGYEPMAALGFLVRMDFEGDQWTFFKPPPEDLQTLFGVDIHEMQPYRPLPVQIAEQIERGRMMIVELDAWYLPDTSATTYRAAHVKTSIAADAIDPAGETLRYFHNTGLFELRGEDYRGAFRLTDEFSADVLSPYTELVRFDAAVALGDRELRAAAHRLLARHLAKRPRENPFEQFGIHLQQQLPSLLESGLDTYHAYAFATVRMAGAAFELAASHTEWLLGRDGERAVTAMREIVEACKTLSFRLARRRQFDPEPLLATLRSAWADAIDELEARV
jgi:hypothetical protein